MESQKKARKQPGERLTRNMAVATLLLLTVVGVREAIPGGSGILQTIKETVESQWDQNVGRLTYVSGSLADSIQVFGSSVTKEDVFYQPVSAPAVQAWSSAAPYLGYENPGSVFAAAKGEVTQISHDDDEQYIIRISHENGLNTIYYGLNSCFVQEGDPVNSDTVLGQSGQTLAFQVQRNGTSLDYSNKMRPRDVAP